MTKEKEQGAASLLIDLSDGVISVFHGVEQKHLLFKRKAHKGDWDKLYNYLHKKILKEE